MLRLLGLGSVPDRLESRPSVVRPIPNSFQPGFPCLSHSLFQSSAYPPSLPVEQIKFPLSFAPSIKFSGFEDIWFAPGWSRSDSPEFWTYKFAWKIDEDPRLSEERLAALAEIYFDVLSRAVSQLGDTLLTKSCRSSLESNRTFSPARAIKKSQRTAVRWAPMIGQIWGVAKIAPDCVVLI